MIYFLVLLLVIFLYETFKHPELGTVFAISLIGFGPIVDLYVGASIKFVAVAALFLIELVKAIDHRKVKGAIAVFFLAIFLKEILATALGQKTESFILAIYIYVILFGITYFSFLENKRIGGDFVKQYSFYIIGCLLIQLYRATIDYSFFGLALSDDIYGRYSEYYSYGSYSYRPSSLQSSINFSIELSVFMGLFIYKGFQTRYNRLLLISCLLGLIITFSRSGMLILMIAVLWYFFKSKKPLKYFIIFLAIMISFMVTLNYTDRFIEIFDLQGENAAYATRFGSINDLITKIAYFDAKEFFLGLGVGTVNAPQANGDFLYYVENYYLAFFVDNGLVAFMVLILFLMYVVSKGWRRNKNYVVLCSAVMLTNFVSANLQAYTVYMLFLTLCFNALYSQKSLAINVRK